MYYVPIDDFNRVVLKELPGREYTDYVNASYVDVSGTKYPIKDPPRQGQLPNKGNYSGPLSHSNSSFLTFEKRTTSQQRTKWLALKVSFIRRFHCKPAVIVHGDRHPFHAGIQQTKDVHCCSR